MNEFVAIIFIRGLERLVAVLLGGSSIFMAYRLFLAIPYMQDSDQFRFRQYIHFDFGVGRGEITQGRLQNGVIYYSWNWYYQSGKGTFTFSNQGDQIRGQWGYSQYGRVSSSNGGEWILTKEVSQAQSLIHSMR